MKTPPTPKRLGKPSTKIADELSKDFIEPAAEAKAIKIEPAADDFQSWNLRLYIAGLTPNSIAALRNLEQFCEGHLAGRYRIEVVDLKKNPELAQGDQILAVPTVVRKLPAPIRKIIGNMSDVERVLVGLDLRVCDPAQIEGKGRK